MLYHLIMRPDNAKVQKKFGPAVFGEVAGDEHEVQPEVGVLSKKVPD